MNSCRLRIFAGPNGSGKSTLFSKVSSRFDCGIFINADEIKYKLDKYGSIDLFAEYGIHVQQSQLEAELDAASFLIRKAFESGEQIRIKVENGAIHSHSINRVGYEAALLAQIIRKQLAALHVTYSFESVFSDSGKIAEIERAKAEGYRIYLYFVSLDSPELNMLRVEDRVLKKGHFVPAEKIYKRYYRSLENLAEIVKLCNRCYFFDNSEKEMCLLAELNGANFISHSNVAPHWFYQYLLKPMQLT